MNSDPLKAMKDLAMSFGGLFQQLGADAPSKGASPGVWTTTTKVTMTLDLPNLVKAFEMSNMFGAKPGGRFHKIASIEIGGVEHEVGSWKQAMQVFVTELAKAGHITGDTPLPSGKRRRPVVSKDPGKLKGRTSDSGAHIVAAGGFSVNTRGNVGVRVGNMIAICEHVGISPITIRVRVTPK